MIATSKRSEINKLLN